MGKPKCLVLSSGTLEVSVIIERDEKLEYTQMYFDNLKKYSYRHADTNDILLEMNRFYTYWI